MTFLVFILTCLAVLTVPTKSADNEVNVTRLQEVVSLLSRQVMMQQQFAEERIRTSGHSGLKTVRFARDGTRAYYSTSHIGYSAAAIHDHADFYNTVGLGEIAVVLNGVDFRTRHNDYLLRAPSKTSQEHGVTYDVPYPPVPKEVLDKESLQDQIQELRLWFKAWADQDYSVRDYRPYFKPLLSYIEGTWTEADAGTLDEPFESKRHHLNAKSWLDLQNKVRYTSYMGGKDYLENFAFLPTTIMHVDNVTGEPVFAQWNYRILVHELKDDLPTSTFKPAGDLHKRYALRQTMDDFTTSRSERYILNPLGYDRRFRVDILDDLMYEIPGMNNYPAKFTDDTFNTVAYNPMGSYNEALNAGYYHRLYTNDVPDAMGRYDIHRGFSDRNLFLAFNNQSKVSPTYLTYCEQDDECEHYTARVSYAIPLEVIYLTPLHSWNPYGIVMHNTTGAEAEGGRDGSFTKTKAFNGNSDRFFYTTPAEFFQGGEVKSDAADTVKGAVGVLDRNGNVRNVTASGVRVQLPVIPGVGSLRTRYPIYPLHEEGTTAFKEIEALRIMMMDMQRNLQYFEVPPDIGVANGSDTEPQKGVTLYTSVSTFPFIGRHSHSVTLSPEETNDVMYKGATLTVSTSMDNIHSHQLKIQYNNKDGLFKVLTCDRLPACWDGHDNTLYTLNNE